MIASKDFIWGHIPKTGGDLFFNLFDSKIGCKNVELEKYSSPGKHDKHALFTEHYSLAELKNKKVILGIRRLPSFYLSIIHHFTNYGWYPKYKRLKKPTDKEIFDINVKYCPEIFDEHKWRLSTIADDMLSQYTVDFSLDVFLWIRLEYFLNDFLVFVREFYPYKYSDNFFTGDNFKNEEDNIFVGKIFKGVKGVGKYNHNFNEVFNKEEISTLYKNNPKWAEIEENVYR